MDLTILVNKQNCLKREDIPLNLITIDQNENNFHCYIDPTLKPMIDERAYLPYLNLCEEAKKDGFFLIVDSAYRSFYYQEKVFDTFRKDKGEEYANSFVALPGTSEHQTGLAIDFAAFHKGIYDDELTKEEIDWLKNNAHKFGFILRYPEGKENITGYNYEPWHYRYVGELSILFHQFNITLEEYYLNKDYYDSFQLSKNKVK